MQRPVSIWSEGCRLSADLWLPDATPGDERLPGILLCHGWGGPKEHLNATYAPFFAEAGFAVLAFDYRGWGESEGKLEPVGERPRPDDNGEVTVRSRVAREVVDPFDQIRDIYNCLDWLSAEPQVDPDRIGLWGTSYGGGHVAWMAAHEPRVKVIVAQVSAQQRQPGSQCTPDPYRAVTKSGDVIWLQTYISRLETPGEAGRLVSYSVDITNMVALQAETCRQEQRLRNVIEATAVGTWEWNIATGEIGINDRWAAILGYTREELEPVTFDSWQRFAHPDDIEPTLAALEDNVSRVSQHYLRDCRMRHKDGHWVWILSRGNITEFDAHGAPAKVAGIILDISDQKAAEATILETNEALKRSNIELERFAYVASHDLQEPLRMVASFTQLLQKKYSDQLDETAREYIQFAFDGAQRMQQLIRDLLSYSRLGRQDIDESAVDVAALVARVMQSLQLAIDDSGARIDCGELPVIRGDTGQLHRLLQNLIGNAIKYHGSEPPRIALYTETRDGETVFCVRDNGIGIDVAQSARVFEIFQRLHSRTDYPGTGIGLSVCKRIVERHGGRIWFEPAPDSGTVFCFTVAADRYSALRLAHTET